MELACAVQQYAWGKLGSSSQVARLAAQACTGLTVNEETPYAELWMGSHPNGPSRLAKTGVSLSDHISQDPACLGQKIRERFGDHLPYLFKVLSVGKALSIQAHPDKAHAEQLHRERPEVYKDPNHKPEIAIALTDFEGLCGFRPLHEIQAFLASVPELSACIGAPAGVLAESTETDYTGALREAFQGLMLCDKEVLKLQLESLSSRLSSSQDPVSTLFKRLHSQYPGDVGCLVLYFLNVLSLTPGEAMFLGPNVPHAYLAGDCVECMANSDNVVRAGLTPKLIDTPTLVAMLDYSCSPAEDRKFFPRANSQVPGCQEFEPPVPDFAVARHTVSSLVSLPVRDTASLLLVTQGQGRQEVGGLGLEGGLEAGTVLFLPAGQQIKVEARGEQMVVFQAYCSL